MGTSCTSPVDRAPPEDSESWQEALSGLLASGANHFLSHADPEREWARLTTLHLARDDEGRPRVLVLVSAGAPGIPTDDASPISAAGYLAIADPLTAEA